MSDYNFAQIEANWQKLWFENNLYKAEDFDQREKKYILVEFPFPSGANLHVGHLFRYTVPDVFSRFWRMKGYNVLHPMGWDSFGLPTEENARKTGQSPQEVTLQNTTQFKELFHSMGFGYDWEREIFTSNSDFYKWTQWIFGQMWENNLVHQEEIELWWCEKLACVLANEEVIEKDGIKVSERGEHPVERRRMKQWTLKITDYADKLLEGLNELDWPEYIKEMQRNWIGRSSGCEVNWEVVKLEE